MKRPKFLLLPFALKTEPLIAFSAKVVDLGRSALPGNWHEAEIANQPAALKRAEHLPCVVHRPPGNRGELRNGQVAVLVEEKEPPQQPRGEGKWFQLRHGIF